MLVLALDTSSIYGSVAVRGATLTAAIKLDDGWQHGRLLLSAVDKILREHQLTAENIDLFVCGVGPGSYTGTRIGVIAAKTLAWAVGKKLVGVASLAAMAQVYWTAPDAPEHRRRQVVVLQPARQDELYVGVYEFTETGWARAVQPEVALNPRDAVNLITDEREVIGAGWEKYPPVFEPLMTRGIKFHSYAGEPPLALGLAEIAARGGGEIADPLTLAPQYPRREEAPCSFEKFMTR